MYTICIHFRGSSSCRMHAVRLRNRFQDMWFHRGECRIRCLWRLRDSSTFPASKSKIPITGIPSLLLPSVNCHYSFICFQFCCLNQNSNAPVHLGFSFLVVSHSETVFITWSNGRHETEAVNCCLEKFRTPWPLADTVSQMSSYESCLHLHEQIWFDHILGAVLKDVQGVFPAHTLVVGLTSQMFAPAMLRGSSLTGRKVFEGTSWKHSCGWQQWNGTCGNMKQKVCIQGWAFISQFIHELSGNVMFRINLAGVYLHSHHCGSSANNKDEIKL